MPKGLRFTLWTLSSLAVLWTPLSLAMLAGMGRMPGMDGGMHGDGMIGGGMMADSAMMGGMMMAGMLQMALVLLVMLGLDAMFVYLIVSTRRSHSREA